MVWDENNSKKEVIMMAKRIGLLVMIIILAGTYFATDSSAAQQWLTCKVEVTGTAFGNTYVNLTHTTSTFTKKWFLVPTSSAKEVLAVALTAMSSGLPVIICADLGDLSLGYPSINAFYLSK
jgi:hypothetical protein